MGYMPFAGAKQILDGEWDRKGMKGIARWNRLSSVSRDFIQRLLVVRPARRMTANQALQHPFIKSHEGQSRQSPVDGAIDREIADALFDFAQASRFRRACM